ncbi:MAG: metallophosphoesterase [Spirochaetes bacterium]|nr:metallophosphoesterase [Spirochaetota bacterium]
MSDAIELPEVPEKARRSPRAVAGFGFFILIALGVYASFNALLLGLNLRAISPGEGDLRAVMVLLTVLSASAFIGGRFIERVAVNRLTLLLSAWGSLWLGFLIYDLLWLAVILLALHLASFAFVLPESATAWGTLASGALAILTLAAGWVNARHTVVRRISIVIPKKGPEKGLRIAMASDLHMGSLIGRRRMENFAALVNRLSPDLVLIAGDAIDEDLAPVLRQNTGEALATLKAPLGVWACTGNHEYIGGVEPAVAYLEAHGVKVLRDRWVEIAGVVVAGREDASSHRFGGRRRKSLAALLAGADASKPLILLDHQPSKLEQAREAGVDLQVSGHTHHGQLWPVTFFTRLLFERSYGYLKKQGTHYFVSSGYGTWGPPVRLGSRSEVVLLNLSFTG